MADDDAKKWLSCLGWGCLVVVVIAVVGIGGCVAFVYKGGSGAHAVAVSYLEAVDAGRYEDAFANLGSDFVDGGDLDRLIEFERAARADLGLCADWRMSGTSFNREGGRSLALLRFEGSCESGAVTAAFSLEQIDRGWVIQDIRYNEPVRRMVVICTECGGVVPPGANFCPFCGAGVGAEPPTVDDSGAGVEEPE